MTKYCKRCDTTKSVELFTKALSRYDGLQVYCRECMKSYRLEHYYNNKKQYRDRNIATRNRLKEIIWELKKNPCLDCGTTYPDEPWLMEFDHLDEKEKLSEVSKLVRQGSARKLEEEILKCDLLCIVCHRRRTAKRGGWTSSTEYGTIESIEIHTDIA